LSGLSLILINNLVPIFVVAGAGYAFGRLFKPDVKTLSRLAFYIFSPCLVFNSLSTSQLPARDFWQMALFTALTILTLGLVAGLLGLILRVNRETHAGLAVVTMFGNAGNFGLPLVLFAFGEEALSRAVIYYVTATIFVYTVGVIIASTGQARPLEALKGVLKVPAFYGLLLAAAMNRFGWELPVALSRPLDLLAQAAIPAMLLVLGLQLAEVQRPERLGLVTAASAFKLLVGPLIGLGYAALLGLTGPSRQAAVIEASMPAAVITTILAVEYGVNPTFVTGVVVLATLLSPLTVTPLIAYLGG
jgi:predicted permease